MRIEIFYEAPVEVIELNAEQEEAWSEYRESRGKLVDVRDAGEYMILSRASSALYNTFLDLIEEGLKFGNLVIEDICEW